ncbi:MAG: class I SAM-dependent methyltransferase [Pseudomonadota bacterium]
MSEPCAADIYDPNFVKEVFDRCSGKYIWFSTVCSLGFTQVWRNDCVKNLGGADHLTGRGYDLMSGTGEIWPHLLKRQPNIDKITAIDISDGMHTRAMTRLHKMRAHKIEFIADNVLETQLAPESADFVVSTFGLKTFSVEQLESLADLVERVLKPGGSFSLIEASDPKGWWLRPLYLFHLKTVLPLIERVFLQGAQDFSMIGTYSTNFGDASAFAEMLRIRGLNTVFKKHFFGCATSVSGTKPLAT